MSDIENFIGSSTENYSKIMGLDVPARSYSADGWLDGYSYRKLIYINGSTVVSGSHTNFPMLVKIDSDDDLRTTGNGGHVQNASGYDIVFADSDGFALLDFDRVYYDASNGHFHAYVLLTYLTDKDKPIYIYYGNSSISTDQEDSATVWSEYDGVWHLEEESDGTGGEYKDAKLGADPWDGTGHYGSSEEYPGRVTGKVGYAASFVASPNDTHIDLQNNTVDADVNNYTLEAWIYVIGTASNRRVFAYDDDFTFSVGVDSGSNVWLRSGSTSREASSVITTETWYYVQWGAESGTRKIYVNGENVSHASGGPSADPSFNAIGAGYAHNNYTANGYVDEVRMYAGARNSDYAATTYNNMGSPDTFYTLGDEESI